MSKREAGKGDAPRAQQDHDAYSEGYDRIFGKRSKKDPVPPDEVEKIIVDNLPEFYSDTDKVDIAAYNKLAVNLF